MKLDEKKKYAEYLPFSGRPQIRIIHCYDGLWRVNGISDLKQGRISGKNNPAVLSRDIERADAEGRLYVFNEGERVPEYGHPFWKSCFKNKEEKSWNL